MKSIKAFSDRPFPNGPEPDGGFNREGQLIEVGIPEGNNFPLKEGVVLKPYYLGKETKFYETLDKKKYPTLSKVLKRSK